MNHASCADARTAKNGRLGADHDTLGEFDLRPDDRKCADSHVICEPCTRIDHCAWVNVCHLWLTLLVECLDDSVRDVEGFARIEDARGPAMHDE